MRNFTYAAEKAFNLRCLTAGISMDPHDYAETLEESVLFLRKGGDILQEAGYSLQMMRLASDPFGAFTGPFEGDGAVDFLKDIFGFLDERGVFFSMGPILISDRDKKREIDILCSILPETMTFSGIEIASSAHSVSPENTRLAAETILRLMEIDPMANFQFAALAHVRPETPFFPAAFHAGDGKGFSIGTESAGLVMKALEQADSPESAAAAMKIVFESEFREIEHTAREIERSTGWTYYGIDTSPAPMKDVSIGRAVEEMTGFPFGSPGTMAACATITRTIQELPVRKAGYCGLMLPVMEDEVLALRAAEGMYSLYDLLSYSAVCGTGLDVVPLPGDISVSKLESLLRDLASLSDRWKKPLSARLIPIPGKKSGDPVKLDSPYLVPTRIFHL